MFQGRFSEVSWIFKESFNGVSSKIKGCFIYGGPISGFQGHLKEVLRGFQERLKGFLTEYNLKEVQRVFQGSFKGV